MIDLSGCIECLPVGVYKHQLYRRYLMQASISELHNTKRHIEHLINYQDTKIYASNPSIGGIVNFERQLDMRTMDDSGLRSDECLPSGYARISSRDHHNRCLAFIGLSIICMNKPISMVSRISGMRRPAIERTIRLAYEIYGVQMCIIENHLVVLDMGDMLSSNPLPFIKRAFPTGKLYEANQYHNLY